MNSTRQKQESDKWTVQTTQDSNNVTERTILTKYDKTNMGDYCGLDVFLLGGGEGGLSIFLLWIGKSGYARLVLS